MIYYIIVHPQLFVRSQFFNAIQMVLEESLLKNRDVNIFLIFQSDIDQLAFLLVQIPPLRIVGTEGMWGIFLMSFIILPVMYYVPGSDEGSYENSLVQTQKFFF
jgi:hypothetical protein